MIPRANRPTVALLAFALLVSGGPLRAAPPPLPAEARTLADAVSADELRGRLSFLASDLLEGRGTPSRGLDLAAEYIASEFRRAGLEAGGDDGYFHTATWPPADRETDAAAGEPVKVRNVVGILRGADPRLRDTCVMVTAHYDHLGMAAQGEGDRIYNGANDDASGVVAMLELAAVFARAKSRPKRSLVFVAFYGEERGLVGSRHYAAHPVFPLKQTVAMINLEQVGRTDDREGPQLRSAAVTGFEYSDVGPILRAAGEQTGIRVFNHPRYSEPFFPRSDNQALADAGVPAHTLSVAFVYPDYHRPGDHWEKIDYDNMAAVTRMLVAGVHRIASDPTAPKWNAANPVAARYLRAWGERK